VQSAQKLEVSFDLPSDGWVGLDLRVGDQHLFESVSHIYPGLRDLCAGLCDVLNDAPSRPIVLYLEPAELELLISPESSDLWRLTASIFPDRRRSSPTSPTISAALPAATIVLAFWRALRRLQTSLSPEEFAARFREPFPSLEMASLTELLEARKTAV
jgi:hypothetical protein